jgi:WD40 repeat protein
MTQTPKLPSTLINTLSTHTGPVNALKFSSLGGTYILTGSSDRQIHLSRTEPSQTTQTTTTPIQKYASHGYPILSLSVSHDNQTFASAGGDRSVFLWDVQNNDGTTRRFGSSTSQGHTSRITCVSFAGEGDSLLVSGSDDTSVRIWDVKSRDGRPVLVLEEAKDGISALCVPDSGYGFISGSVDGRVRSYDIRTGKVTVDVLAGSVTSLDVSRDGKTLLVGSLDGRIRMLDRSDGTCLRAFPPEGESGYMNQSLRLKSCFGMNEALVLSGSESDGKVRAWDVLSGKSVESVQVSPTDKVVSVVQWREGSQAQGRRSLWAGGGADGIVKIYGEN